MTETSSTTTAVLALALLVEQGKRANLPDPIVAKTYFTDQRAELQFRTRVDLAAWARFLDTPVDDKTVLIGGQPLTDVAKVQLRFCDTPFTLVAVAAHPVKAAS